MRQNPFLTFFILLLWPFMGMAQTTLTEAQVNQRIQKAKDVVISARNQEQQAESELQQQAVQLQQRKQDWNKLQDNLLFAQQRLESAGNSLNLSVSHQDNELNRYKQKLQRLLQQGGRAEEIEETRRYITAYENWKANRLRKNGLNAWISGLQRYQQAQQTQSEALRPQLQAAINNTKKAELKLEDARIRLQAKEAALLQLYLDAPQMLSHILPPYLQKVIVKQRGKIRYAAEWDDYSKLIDEQIKIIQKGIEEQNSVIESQKALLIVTSDELLAQNRLAQEKLDAYVDEVQGWGVTKVIMADLLDAGISIARNFKEMGPYAFAYEAVYRVGEAGLWATGVTGPINPGWDVTNMPTQPNRPVDNTSVPVGYGTAIVKDQVKGQILNALKSYIGASEFGIPGKGISFAALPQSSSGNFRSISGLTDKMSSFRSLINEGKFWVVADDALREKWLAPVNDPNAPGGVRSMFNTLKRNPRQFLQNLKSSFNKNMLKGALLDMAQSSLIQYLKNWANETRLELWSDCLVEDLKREELTTFLKATGSKLRFMQQTLLALNEVLLDLIKEKENQAENATRFLKPLDDDVLSGSGNFTLILEFSAPVVTDSVVLGGKRIDGAAKDKTWSGSFSLTGIQEDDLAQLVVAARGSVTQKRLDDPITEAKFKSTTQQWSGYEQISDRYHKIKLKALRKGTSILMLVDCSGSMDENNRMQKAKDAIEKVLNSTQFEPTDEVALMAFYGCGSIRILQPFTSSLELIKNKLPLLVPSNNTPLASSMIAASYYLESSSRTSYRKMIVLTDGEESCNGNEFEALQRIKQFHQDVKKAIL